VTHDAGDTWQQSILPLTISGASPLTCIDADICAALGVDASGAATLLETTGGGASWVTAAGPSDLTSANDVTELSCTSAASCVAVSADPDGSTGAAMSFVTDTGGASWRESALPAGFVPARLQCFPSGSCVVAGLAQAAQGSTILRSTDGGITWSPASVTSGLGPLTSLSCADSSDCVATFFGGDRSATEVLTSTDGGASWNAVAAVGLPAGAVTGLSCSGTAACWASGIAGRAAVATGGSAGITVTLYDTGRALLASTADAGQDWQPAQLAEGLVAVTDVECPTSAACYALAIQPSGPASPAELVLLAYGS
jgi:photosystem II stability/assembly factor-like uncharacterized protein